MAPRSAADAARPSVAAPVFAALGDETRLRLAARLSHDGPLSIARLSSGFPMSRQAISKHLRVMEAAGVVRSTHRGRESLWQIERKRLDEAQRQLQAISTEWDRRLYRLKRLVEA